MEEAFFSLFLFSRKVFLGKQVVFASPPLPLFARRRKLQGKGEGNYNGHERERKTRIIYFPLFFLYTFFGKAQSVGEVFSSSLFLHSAAVWMEEEWEFSCLEGRLPNERKVFFPALSNWHGLAYLFPDIIEKVKNISKPGPCRPTLLPQLCFPLTETCFLLE